MKTLTDRLRHLYPLLTELRIAEASSKNYESVPHFLGLLLAASESEDRRGACFVFPDTFRIADTLAMLSSLSWLSREFEDLARAYALRELKPGQRVRIRPTEFVYEYDSVLEATEQYPERVRLKVQGKNEYRALHIGDVLRLEPTKRVKPKGQINTPLSFTSQPDPLNTLLGIRTYGNTSILRNRVLYLTSKSRFESFLSSTECLRRNGTAGAAVTLAESLPWGTVQEDGTFSSSDSYQVEGEPLLAISHSVENIAEASLMGDPFSRIVLCDNPRSLTRNLQACDEITESQKLVVIASHGNSEAIKILKDRDFVVWHVSPEEIQLSCDIYSRSESSYFGKSLIAAKNYQELKLADVDCRDVFVESAAENLLRASDELKHPDSDEEAKRCLGRLFNLLFSISDRCVPLDADEKIEVHDRLSEVRISISKRKLYISDSVEANVSEFCMRLSRLISSNTPGSRVGERKGEVLLEQLQKDNGIHQRSLIVTRYSENVASVQNWLQQQGVDTPVVWHRSLPEDETFDRIILTSWLNSEWFGELVKKYTSPHISLLVYPFEKTWLRYYKVRLSKERSENQTGNDERSAISGIPEVMFPALNTPVQKTTQIVEDDSRATSIFEIERKILRRRKGTRPSIYSSPDACESRYVGFVGEFYAHLTESREMPVVTSLLTGHEPSTGTVPERTVNELEFGDFILFREGSDKDVVQLFAEESIGQEEYGTFRKLANVWREALLARGGSVRELHRLLKSYGLRKTESTVRGWRENKRRIGPNTKKDVQIIAGATKEFFLANPDDVWEAIYTIRNAHKRAGHQISAWLLEELSDRRSLVADGGGRIDLGFGELQIVEVEEIGTELEKHPASMVNRLLRER